MHIGEAAVNAVLEPGEFCVLKAEKVEHCGVDVINLCGVAPVERFVAPLVAFADRYAAFDAAAAQPIREHIRIMIAAFAALRAGHSAKLGRP